MKFFVIVCSLATVARGSLEPAGYRRPGSDPLSAYLPPSSFGPTPDNRYVPSVVDSRSHAKFSNDLASPTKNSPIPFTEYLPADRQSAGRETHGGDNYARAGKPSNRYVPAAEIRHSLTQALPAGDYLPPRQSRPSNAYLAPKKYAGQSAAGFSRITSGSSPSGQYSGSGVANQFNKRVDQASTGQYPSAHGGLSSAPKTAGYSYNAPENQTPAQYDFEYKVKDNIGNDYSHRESRNGENAQGVYMVLLPDRRRQIVHYEADSHGYRPTITYEDTGSQSAHSDQGYRY